MSSDPPRASSSSQARDSDVLLYVEQDAPSKFRIQSDQLEQIGAKLRGPRPFSVFNSLILPALVTLLTTILTGTFQYLSWINTVRLQSASAIADRADETFGKTAALIGKRRYATLIFIPSVRDLVQTNALDADQGVPANNGRLSRENQAADEAFLTVSAKKSQPVRTHSLTNVSLDLDKRRYDAYYDQLAIWNEDFDQLIADIDNNLDRPIFADAAIGRTSNIDFHRKIDGLNCRNYLPQELTTAQLNKHSLKLQFASISKCFQALHHSLDSQLTQLRNHSIANLSSDAVADAGQQLSDILTNSNEFRCVALLRIGYYKRQKERSIAIPSFIRRWLFDPAKAGAEIEFRTEEENCTPDKRPT